MYAYPLEEMAWAITSEREEECRRARPRAGEARRHLESGRSWVARWLTGDGEARSRHVPQPGLTPAGSGCR